MTGILGHVAGMCGHDETEYAAKSVRLACRQYPWLAQEAVTFTGNNERFAALEEHLQAQDIMQAGLGSMALFNIFLNELASLIGERLTTHLLRLTSSQQISAIPPEDFPG